MPNPFLTVHGPRPERWWAVCNLCGQTSRPRFKSAEEAGGWEHDCYTPPGDDDGKVTLTVEYTVDDPPQITWTGNLVEARIGEIRNAFADMLLWGRSSWWRDDHPDWRDMVDDQWRQRRDRATAAAMSALDDIIERPFKCPACQRPCKSLAGLKTHMRSCRQVDRAKLANGGYDAAMVPGGLSQGPETA